MWKPRTSAGVPDAPGVPDRRGFRLLGWESGVPDRRGAPSRRAFRLMGWRCGFRLLGWESDFGAMGRSDSALPSHMERK